jgi:uncharacterized protein (TIGR02301 family)
MTIRSAALALLIVLGAGAAAAQAPAPAPASRQSHAEWYEGQLIELSRVLGGAHYLRTLCGGRGDQRWRDYMRGVISRAPERQAELVAGFNQGYRDEQTRFEDCDRTAEQTEAELRAHGLRIADGLSATHEE